MASKFTKNRGLRCGFSASASRAGPVTIMRPNGDGILAPVTHTTLEVAQVHAADRRAAEVIDYNRDASKRLELLTETDPIKGDYTPFMGKGLITV